MYVHCLQERLLVLLLNFAAECSHLMKSVKLQFCSSAPIHFSQKYVLAVCQDSRSAGVLQMTTLRDLPLTIKK